MRLRRATRTRKGKSWRGHITTCKRAAGGYTITVRPRSRTKTLRQVVGKNFGIGVVSESTKPNKVTATFKVR